MQACHVRRRLHDDGYLRRSVTGPDLAALLNRAVDAVVDALGNTDEWGLAGTKPGQYRSDLTADAAALAVLDEAGVGVLSEESGLRRGSSDVVVVVDPLDGSTNASRGLSWWATSMCAVDDEGAAAAVVHDLVGAVRYEAVRGWGAHRDGVPIGGSGAAALADALVGLSGFPPRHLGWRQYRTLGAAALDLCAVADGRLDAFVDCHADAHGPWDYLGGMLVCLEAGVLVGDAFDRELVVIDHRARRTPVAAATPSLYDELVEARRAAERDEMTR